MVIIDLYIVHGTLSSLFWIDEGYADSFFVFLVLNILVLEFAVWFFEYGGSLFGADDEGGSVLMAPYNGPRFDDKWILMILVEAILSQHDGVVGPLYLASLPLQHGELVRHDLHKLRCQVGWLQGLEQVELTILDRAILVPRMSSSNLHHYIWIRFIFQLRRYRHLLLGFHFHTQLLELPIQILGLVQQLTTLLTNDVDRVLLYHNLLSDILLEQHLTPLQPLDMNQITFEGFPLNYHLSAVESHKVLRSELLLYEFVLLQRHTKSLKSLLFIRSSWSEGYLSAWALYIFKWYSFSRAVMKTRSSGLSSLSHRDCQ